MSYVDELRIRILNKYPDIELSGLETSEADEIEELLSQVFEFFKEFYDETGLAELDDEEFTIFKTRIHVILSELISMYMEHLRHGI